MQFSREHLEPLDGRFESTYYIKNRVASPNYNKMVRREFLKLTAALPLAGHALAQAIPMSMREFLAKFAYTREEVVCRPRSAVLPPTSLSDFLGPPSIGRDLYGLNPA